jgi:signal transduction histidine kinase
VGGQLRIASERGIELSVAVDADVPERLLGDPRLLRESVRNLVNNAVKFTSQGSITVNAKIKANHVDGRVTLSVSVSDTGIGIALENQGSIFEAFTQVDASSTRRYGGLGLGLAIAGKLIGMMGGTIWLESAPGKGSKFHFTAVFGAVED